MSKTTLWLHIESSQPKVTERWERLNKNFVSDDHSTFDL